MDAPDPNTLDEMLNVGEHPESATPKTNGSFNWLFYFSIGAVVLALAFFLLYR